MPEGLAPISSSRIATGDIARHSFAIVRRGFDTDEVRSYLQSVARSIEALEEREQELRAAVAEAEDRAAHPVVDEATLTASLGQHSGQILRHAHEEAARIVEQAQERAATLLRETQTQVDELQARTEASSAERVGEVELLVANARQEARAEQERIVAEAVAEGEQVIGRAKDEGRALLEQVQEARRRVLADLAARRRALGIQIEQLRAARDEMAASVGGVRDRVDDILVGLQRVDDEARAAALAAGDQARLHPGEEAPHDQDAADGDEAPGETATAEPAAGVDREHATDEIAVVDAAVADAGSGAAADAGAEDPETTAPSVDELFARIRAGSEEEGAPATPSADAAPQTAVAEAAAPAEEAPTEAEEPSGPDAPLIARRDDLLDPITSRLGRSIKRALADDQNRLLDLLRSAPAASGDALVGTEDEHVATFAAAAQSHLAEAFAAGAVFGGSPAGAVADDGSVEQATGGMARTVATMLRRRIGEGHEEPAQRVGVAFREWRGERIERLVGDFATQAFSAGVLAATGSGQKIRWVLTRTGGCSDCDDNALAGAVAVAESFPTGHPHPPAHAGCRCLVAPMTA
jgi:DivIVA domain-containing protein